MTDYKATPEQWAQCEDWVRSSVVGASDACILELRARVEALEAAAHKHIVETTSNIVALFTRVESLEAAEREASKVYQISKPLRLTPDQVQQALDQLLPKIKPSPDSSQIRSSLLERVVMVIGRDGETARWNEARATIREVAAWLREQHDGDLVAATVLEREAER
jgi:hypothetical protein